MLAPEILLTPADLAALRGGDDAPVVLDVLPEAVFAARHLPDARNACVYEVVFGERVGELVPDRATPLVVYGAGEPHHDAAMAAEKLQRLGYTRVRVLAGGVAAWHAAGMPLAGERAAPLPPETPPALADGRWRVDPDASWLRWVGRNPGGFHDGAVDITGGEVAVAGADVRGEVAVDPRSLRNFDLAGDSSQPVLVAHLLSDDFLFADRFATARFHVQEVAPIAGAALTSPTHTVSGQLELRGVTAPLSFAATVSERPGGRLAVSAQFPLDRTRWGMIYGSARFLSHLGMHVVFDLVDIALRLELTPA